MIYEMVLYMEGKLSTHSYADIYNFLKLQDEEIVQEAVSKLTGRSMDGTSIMGCYNSLIEGVVCGN